VHLNIIVSYYHFYGVIVDDLCTVGTSHSTHSVYISARIYAASVQWLITNRLTRFEVEKWKALISLVPGHDLGSLTTEK